MAAGVGDAVVHRIVRVELPIEQFRIEALQCVAVSAGDLEPFDRISHGSSLYPATAPCRRRIDDERTPSRSTAGDFRVENSSRPMATAPGVGIQPVLVGSEW